MLSERQHRLISVVVPAVALVGLAAVGVSRLASASASSAPSPVGRIYYDPSRFHTRLSPTEKQHILDGRFAVVDKTEAMPEPVKQAFATMTSAHPFALANPGQRFQDTDVLDKKGLPSRRLVFAGEREGTWFIHYEKGGRGNSYFVLVFKIDSQGSPQFLWGGAGFERAKNLDGLRALIADRQFSDEIAFLW
jgi:hypothetical protein